MARPRVFVSSTYYDLRHIRNSLEGFIEGFGYEAVLFESGDIAFRHDTPLDESCYHEIQNCHMLVLIIGGRYGSPTTDSGPLSPDDIDAALRQYNSITKREYETARERDIPVFIFVEKSVLAEYQTFKENRDNEHIKYAHVDSINIFRLLDDIIAQRRNNFVRPFDSYDDISKWLRDQWAGLFADFLSEKRSERSLSDLASQLGGLRQVVSVLKEYSESIMRKVQPDDFLSVIEAQERKLRQGRIERFIHEDMIDVLLVHCEDNRPSSDAIYQAFEQATTIDEFLPMAGFTGEKIREFMEKYREPATRDFAEFKQRYLDDAELMKDIPARRSTRRGRAPSASPRE